MSKEKKPILNLQKGCPLLKSINTHLANMKGYSIEK